MIIILNKLNDKDLVNICQVNKLADQICDDQTFWLNRILTKFPYLHLEVLNKYKRFRSWSQYYIYDLRTINKNNSNHYLTIGVRYGRLDWIMIAVQNGADIKDYLVTALVFNYSDIKGAFKKGYLDVVDYLVSMGAPDPR